MNPIPLETVNELAAGSVGGAAQVLVGQPLDTIKTRAQIAPSEVDFPPSLMRNMFSSCQIMCLP